MAIALSTTVGLRSSGASIVLPFGSAIAADSLLTVTTGAGSSAVPSTITDSAGNTWLKAVEVFNANVASASIWYTFQAAGGTNTVTITNAVSAQQINCEAQAWTGTSTSSLLLATASHTSSNASTHTTGSVSGSGSTTLYLANFAFSNAFDITPDPTGYTALNSTFINMQGFYKALSGSTSTENPEAGSSATESSADVIAVFSGLGGGAATVSKRRYALRLLGVS